MPTRGKRIERNECLVQHMQMEIFKFYKKKIKDLGTNSVYNVPMGVVGGIQRDFNKEWMQELVMKKGLIFRLPYGLGRILCKKHKPKLWVDADGKVVTKTLPVDWQKSKQKWAEMWPGKTMEELKEIRNKPVVFLLNEHSGGYRYVIFWDTAGCMFMNQGVYNFVPNRTNHRFLAKVIKDPDITVDYYDLKPKKRKWKNWKKIY